MIFGINSTFGKHMDIVEKGLDVSLLRREVIGDNIANADTPGFKRSEVSFESELERALLSEAEPEFPTYMTDSKHISFNDYTDYQTVTPNITVDYDTSYRNDENGVDIDQEMIDASKNSLHYNAMIEVYSRNIKILDTAIGA